MATNLTSGLYDNLTLACLRNVDIYLDHCTRIETEFKQQSKSNGTSYQVRFMLYLLKIFNLIPAEEVFSFHHILEFLHDYFLRHYNGNDMPLLYAQILYDRCMKKPLYLEDALKYIEIYKKQKNISRNVNEQLIQQHIQQSKLELHILYKLFNQSQINKDYDVNTNLTNKLCDLMINNHQKYSIYDNFCPGFVFISTFCRNLIYLDYFGDQNYKHRYKHSLKLIYNLSLRHIPQLDMQDFGISLLYIGLYYAIHCIDTNKWKKSRKYLKRTIKTYKGNPWIPARKLLYDSYWHLFWVEKTLGNQLNCQKLVQKIIKKDYNKLVLARTTPASTYWSAHMDKVKQNSKRCVLNKDLLFWINCFQNDQKYHIIKNICNVKECNYTKCRRKDVKLSKCSRCKSVFYCTKIHQKKDWKRQHRFQCNLQNKRNWNMTVTQCKLIATTN